MMEKVLLGSWLVDKWENLLVDKWEHLLVDKLEHLLVVLLVDK